MLHNEETALLTSKILLVPYKPCHVPLYHRWMQDPILLAATASEPLSLDQEYEMQKSWLRDHDKLTFISCVAPPSIEAHKGATPGTSGEWDTDDAMVGDINLFLHEVSDENEDEDDEKDSSESGKCKSGLKRLFGEVEIMVADTKLQGKGYGHEILRTFLWYILSYQNTICKEFVSRVLKGEGGASASDGEPSRLEYLRVLIGKDNERSLKLFKRVGFRAVGEVTYFGEVELRLDLVGSSVGDLVELDDEKVHVLKYYQWRE